LSRPLNPLMMPETSMRNWLARWTAPRIVAFSAGVSPPAVRMPIRFMDAPLQTGGIMEPSRESNAGNPFRSKILKRLGEEVDQRGPARGHRPEPLDHRGTFSSVFGFRPHH